MPDEQRAPQPLERSTSALDADLEFILPDDISPDAERIIEPDEDERAD